MFYRYLFFCWGRKNSSPSPFEMFGQIYPMLGTHITHGRGICSGPSATLKGDMLPAISRQNPNRKRSNSNHGNVQVRKFSFQEGWFLGGYPSYEMLGSSLLASETATRFEKLPFQPKNGQRQLIPLEDHVPTTPFFYSSETGMSAEQKVLKYLWIGPGFHDLIHQQWVVTYPSSRAGSSQTAVEIDTKILKSKNMGFFNKRERHTSPTTLPHSERSELQLFLAHQK